MKNYLIFAGVIAMGIYLLVLTFMTAEIIRYNQEQTEMINQIIEVLNKNAG